MSQPPPYSSRPYSENQPRENPDRRPLPPGWISQWDSNYNAWFYVNTQENPPRSSWVHPLGPPGSPRPQAGYAPPSGPPPPDNRGYSPGYQGPPAPQRYDDYRGPSPGYGGQPPSNYGPGPGYGAPARDSRGWFGSSAASAQQPAMIQQAAPKKSGIGMGTALAAGGAGLLGGVILEDLWQNHDEHEREEGYDDAMQDGYGGGGFDGPQDDFGGGGGDFF
ncbi:uncharacterized protein C8Q71DRAFT_730047 [Rhodofomes roseus]|uniref:WW domain-containing protein n=1 Tax=Rhodofomes roseus TaxID=34475 RepID=A0ABQ8KZ81_9APHY|nr:uncharacterized protein C8Q71DRAFT_730047 [Rhodofomes roseus]KAH9843787.1 hypothetical protein C8Q71DRAFT_730047 [Rhodofomes roseus]